MDDDEDEEVPTTDPSDLAATNERRQQRSQIRKKKLTKANRTSTLNDKRTGMVTRSAEKAKNKRHRSGRDKHARSDPGNGKGTKRKILTVSGDEEDDHDDDNTAQSSSSGFNLFASNSPKKGWDEHPQMEKLKKLGTDRM